ncbi:hypothetical protein IWQ61_009536 [Dispira simplex]|nr:hypothetical protein IWQ61_009536 [Dispira simplex]
MAHNGSRKAPVSTENQPFSRLHRQSSSSASSTNPGNQQNSKTLPSTSALPSTSLLQLMQRKSTDNTTFVHPMDLINRSTSNRGRTSRRIHQSGRRHSPASPRSTSGKSTPTQRSQASLAQSSPAPRDGVTPHSSASSVSGGDASTVPHGVILDQRRVVIDVSQPYERLMSKSLFGYMPITLVPSDVQFRIGSIIAVNQDFICYPVKQSKIRVIHRLDGVRTLLQAHTQPIIDMAFCPSLGAGDPGTAPVDHSTMGSLLASVAGDHTVIIWKLCKVRYGSHADIVYQQVLTLNENTQDQLHHRVVWCPNRPGLLVVVAKTILRLLQFSATGLSTDDPSPTNLSPEITHRTVKCISVDSSVCDLDFTPEGHHLLIGHEDGSIRCLHISSEKWTVLVPPGASSRGAPAPVTFVRAMQGNPVNDTPSQRVEEQSSGLPDPVRFVVASDRNLMINVWETTSQASFQLVQELCFTHSTMAPTEMFNTLVYDRSTATLLVANSERKTAFFLNYPSNPLSLVYSSLIVDQPVHAQPILSALFVENTELSVSSHPCGVSIPKSETSNQRALDLFCVQSKSVQQFTIPLRHFSRQRAPRGPDGTVSPPLWSDLVGVISPLPCDTSNSQIVSDTTSLFHFVEGKPSQSELLDDSINTESGNNTMEENSVHPALSGSTSPPLAATSSSANISREINEASDPLVASKLDTILQRITTLEQQLIPAPRHSSRQSTHESPNPISVTQQQQLQTEVRSAVQQAIQSSEFSSLIAEHTKQAIISTVEDTVSRMFETVLIPAYERATAEMFRQMHETFLSGMNIMATNSVLAPTSIHSFQPGNPLTARTVPLVEPLPAVTHGNKDENSEMTPVRTTVTPHPLPRPAPSFYVNQPQVSRILKMVQERQFEDGFKLALINREVLLEVCQTVNPNTITTFDVILSQTTMVGIVSQMLVMLTQDTWMKLSWIQSMLVKLQRARIADKSALKSFLPQLLETLDQFQSRLTLPNAHQRPTSQQKTHKKWSDTIQTIRKLAQSFE